MGMAYFRTQIFKGGDVKRKTDIKKIQIAIEEYEKDHDCYPLPQIVNCNPGDGLKPYMDKIPCDPQTKTSYFYDYDNGSCPSWYILYSKLENDKDDDVTDAIGPGGLYNYFASSPNAPDPTSGSSPITPPGGGGGGQSGFWGCKSGACTPLSSQFECSPNYTSNLCGNGCSSSPECEPM